MYASIVTDAFGAIHRFQHRGIKLVAVVHELDLVARDEHHAGRARDGVEKVGGLNVEFVVEPVDRRKFVRCHQVVHERGTSTGSAPSPPIRHQSPETDDGPGPPRQHQSTGAGPRRDRPFAAPFGNAWFEPADPFPRDPPSPAAWMTRGRRVLRDVGRISAVKKRRLGGRAVRGRRRHASKGGKFRSSRGDESRGLYFTI